MRYCGSCGVSRPGGDYSAAQWAKGVGTARCVDCVANGDGLDSGAALATARDNNASEATVPSKQLELPFAYGTFRWVAKGTYTDGERSGEPCVFKWFKTGGVMEERFFEADLKVVSKSMELVRDWNAARIINTTVRVNQPQVWTFLPGWARSGQKILIEPFIHGYQRFNSNSGWVAPGNLSKSWPAAMQALSHWTYHSTGGQLVLVDLQGGFYAGGVILTDPVVLSTTAGAYGVTDLGPDGIVSFFARHICGLFCRAGWARPRGTPAAGALLPMVQGTTMHRA